MSIPPLTFSPIFKDYPWGGRNLADRLGRDIPDGIVAESWEIAGHDHGSTPVRDGPFAGRDLSDLLAELGERLVGTRNASAVARGRFPLLIKLLDAHRWLSVQVHPNDEYGLAREGDLGKTEMWVVLYAEPGSEIIVGFKRGMTRERYGDDIAAGRAADGLHRLAVAPGDVVFVPAGTVHALGPGIIVAEIQQNSDTTYRIYDWGRPRPIHVEQALEVLDFGRVEPGAARPVAVSGNGYAVHEVLATCPAFQTERIVLAHGQVHLGDTDGSTFEIWAVLEGTAALESDHGVTTLGAVDWVLVPATLGPHSIRSDGGATLLRVFVPQPEGDPAGG